MQTYPLILTTGRIRDQWHTMSKTGKVNKLKQHISESFLEIHPMMQPKEILKKMIWWKYLMTRGNVRVKAKFSADIKKGVVFCPCIGVKF